MSKFGEVCQHKQLKRQCYTCELEEQIEELENNVILKIGSYLLSKDTNHSVFLSNKYEEGIEIENSEFEKYLDKIFDEKF